MEVIGYQLLPYRGGDGIDPSEDSDVVHYSDYHLFDWDDSKEGMENDHAIYYFYSEPEMAKKRSLFGSGCFVNINTQREYLLESDGDYKLYGNTAFSAAIIFLVAEGVHFPMPVPDGLIEGDGYVIVIENGGPK